MLDGETGKFFFIYLDTFDERLTRAVSNIFIALVSVVGGTE